MLHAARCKYRTQQSRQKSPSGHHRTTLTGYIFATKARIDKRKKLLSSNISSRCPHNMVNFGLIAAEILSLVWSTPANFNGFCVLAALLHGTLVVGVSQTAAFNRGRHLHSAGRPSGWALAHISSCFQDCYLSENNYFDQSNFTFHCHDYIAVTYNRNCKRLSSSRLRITDRSFMGMCLTKSLEATS